MPLHFSRKSSRTSSNPTAILEGNSDDDIKMVNTLSDDYQEIEYSAKRARAAARATEAEHKMTIRYTCKRYPKLVFWCLVFNFIATGVEFCKFLNLKTRVPKEFEREFGWKPYYRLMIPSGELAGIFAGSMFADKIGRKLSTGLGIFVTTLGILLECGAQHRPFILGAMVVLGIGLGMLRLNAVVYCSEISPVSFRGVAVAGVPLNAISGVMLANMITHAFIRLDDKAWSFRAPFLLQIIPIAIVGAVLPFVPESPWWLARKYYKIDNARKSLNRIYGKYENVTNLTAALEKTVERENNLGAGCPYIAILRMKYKHLRRTFIILGGFICSGLVGYGFIQRIMVYPFPARIGKSNDDDAFRDISISLACSYFGSLLCLILISTIGRRRSFLLGSCLLPLILLGFAIFRTSSPSSSSKSKGRGEQQQPQGIYGDYSKQNLGRFIFGCIYLFVHSATIGGVAYILIADVSAPIFRSASACLALMLDTVITTVLDYLAPNIIDGMSGVDNASYIFIGLGILGIIWSFFFVPELKRRTFEEVSDLFENDKVSARKMRNYST